MSQKRVVANFRLHCVKQELVSAGPSSLRSGLKSAEIGSKPTNVRGPLWPMCKGVAVGRCSLVECVEVTLEAILRTTSNYKTYIFEQ